MATFAPAIAYVLQNEGGYVNNPNDHGGETNFGLTLNTARGLGYEGEMAEMTQEQAVILWKAGFWDPWKMDTIQNQAVATAILDLHANGSKSAATIIQKALQQLGWSGVVDGMWGPATRAGVNAADPGALIQAFADLSAEKYQNIADSDDTQEQFLTGWLNRAARMASLAGQSVVDAVSENPGTTALVALLIIGGIVLGSGKGRA